MCVGMINLDIVVETFRPEMGHTKSSLVDKISFRTGGDAQNCACTLARLGVNVGINACAGDDYSGEICRREMQLAGVNTSALRTKHGLTGMCVSLVTESGEAMFVYNPGVTKELSLEDIDWQAVEKAKVVSLHSIFLCGKLNLETLFSRARNAGAITVADAVLTGKNENVEEIVPALAYLDYFMPSLDELVEISGVKDPHEGARKVLDMGVGNIVVKLGGEGCLFMNKDTSFTVPGFTVDVVDTTGAGDNFVAGFIYSLVNALDLKEALTFANACGAVAVTKVGSNGAVESARQIQDFILKNTQ